MDFIFSHVIPVPSHHQPEKLQISSNTEWNTKSKLKGSTEHFYVFVIVKNTMAMNNTPQQKQSWKQERNKNSEHPQTRYCKVYLESSKPGSCSQEERIPLMGSYTGKMLNDGMCGKLSRWSIEKSTQKLHEMTRQKHKDKISRSWSRKNSITALLKGTFKWRLRALPF